MANYGYIPRDGMNIKFWPLIHALREFYNLSLPLALFLAIPGYLLCGSILHMSLNLDDLALHDRLEHDASLVHADAAPGAACAPTNVDPGLLHAFITSCPAGRGFRLEDFAKARIAREKTLGGRQLNAFHAEIARGESALSWLLMKDESGEAPPGKLEQWYGEERVPDGWSKPERRLGLITTRHTAVKVQHLIASMSQSGVVQDIPMKR